MTAIGGFIRKAAIARPQKWRTHSDLGAKAMLAMGRAGLPVLKKG